MTILRTYHHSDHTPTWLSTGLGSSSWITNNNGEAIQHLHYLPYGEDWINQRTSATSWNAPYTFSAKEKDVETGYGYFGARYYDSGLSIWLSVDPMSDKYPNMSPFNYCANNPVKLIDPNGMEIDEAAGKKDPPNLLHPNRDTFFDPKDDNQRNTQKASGTTNYQSTAQSSNSSPNNSPTQTTTGTAGIKVENPFFSISFFRSETVGEPGSVNIDVNTSTYGTKNGAITDVSTELQIRNNYGIGVSKPLENITDNGLLLGPVSATQGVNYFSVSVSNSNNKSIGTKMELKPLGAAAIFIIAVAPTALPIIARSSLTKALGFCF
jgi:RHS repeat-associated protein